MAGRRRGCSVTGRAFTLLQAFTTERPELTLSEIARRADVPLTTAHRLTRDLLEWGALERDENGRFRIGLRLWEVASLAPRVQTLRDVARPFLQDLHEVTSQNVQLAVREGLEAVILERISGHDPTRVRTRIGGRFAMHSTAVGLVLLAHAPVDIQDQILASPLQRFSTRTTVQPAKLRHLLAEVRRNGYALSDGRFRPDAYSVAAPIHGANGEVQAALSIVVPDTGVRSRSLVGAVRTSARGVSRMLATQSAAAGPEVRQGRP